MGWNPSKTWKKIAKDPIKEIAKQAGATLIAGPVGAAVSAAHTLGGKKEKKKINHATGGIAGQVDGAAGDVSKGVQNIAKSISPEAYRPGQVTFDKSAFNSQADQLRFQQAFQAQAAAAKNRSAPQMGAAQLGPAAMTSAATIDQDPQGEFRSQQMGLVDQLNQAAAGQGPSLATLQMQQNTDDAIKSAMAIAASGRGGSAGGRLKGAMDQASMMQQQGARDSAALRVQEQLAARDQLNSVLAQGRGQDIGLATDQAGLMQQSMLANQDATNTFGLQQGQFDQGANQANLSATLQQTGMNDQMGQFYQQLGYQTNRDMYGDQQRASELDLQRLLEMERLKQAGIASSNAAKAGVLSGVAQAGATAAPFL